MVHTHTHTHIYTYLFSVCSFLSISSYISLIKLMDCILKNFAFKIAVLYSSVRKNSRLIILINAIIYLFNHDLKIFFIFKKKIK